MAIKDQSKLKIGDKVHYQPSHYDEHQWENGMIKSIPEHNTDSVFVVYNCGGNWKNYLHYTAANTNLRDFHNGWKR